MNETEIFVDRPKLSSFDLSPVPEPSDGILYLYRSSVDRQWYVEADEDMALQEATGYPVGELQEYEAMGDHESAEDGVLHAIYVGEPDDDNEVSMPERTYVVNSSASDPAEIDSLEGAVEEAGGQLEFLEVLHKDDRPYSVTITSHAIPESER